MGKSERIAEFLNYFDPIEVEELYEEVDGKPVTLTYNLKLHDPDTGLLMLTCSPVCPRL